MPKKIDEKKRRKLTGRGRSPPFLGLPHYVIDSPEWADLDGGELKMLIDLARQFNGKNNGNFDVTQLEMRWSADGRPPREKTFEMRPAKFPGARWNSEQKKRRAITNLLAKGWIVKTKQGGFGIGPNLYAVTWLPIDECDGNLDCAAERVASYRWRKKTPGPETGGLSAPETGGLAEQKTASSTPETGPLKAVLKAA